MIKSKGISLEITFNGEGIIYGERVLMRQLIFNLLTNAVKFIKQHGVIKIKGQAKGKFLSLQVIDEGIGFKQSHANHLFEKFSSKTKAGTKGEKSTGLGLYISRKIAERYGAEIRAYSSGDDKGAIFEVNFPMN